MEKMELLEAVLKMLVSVSAPSSPIFLRRLFPDLNFGIVQNVWWSAFAVTATAAIVFFAFSRAVSTLISAIVSVLMLIISFCCLGLLYAIIFDALKLEPAMSAFLARMFFIGFFAALSAGGSIGIALILDWLLPPKPASSA